MSSKDIMEKCTCASESNSGSSRLGSVLLYHIGLLQVLCTRVT